MITALISILLILICIVGMIRRLNNQYLERKFTHQIFALRDRLRLMAILGQVDERVFRYLDYCFSKTVCDACFLTLFHVITRSLQIEKTEDYKLFHEHFDVELDRNEALKDLVQDYSQYLHEYLKGQHVFGYTLIVMPIAKVMMGANNAKKNFMDAINTTLYHPGMSRSALGA